LSSSKLSTINVKTLSRQILLPNKFSATLTLTPTPTTHTHIHNPDPTSNLPLDWTRIGKDCEEDDEHAIRLPIDVVPEDKFDPDDDHLAIIGTSGKKVTKIGGLEGLKLRIICLRSHLIEVRRGVRMWEYATLRMLHAT
jgi:hypothetical protein